MTDIATPPTIAAMPTAPQPTDTRDVFNSRAYATVAAQAGYVAQANALAANVLNNATAAHERAVASQSNALSADNARIAAQAAASSAISAPGSASTSGTTLFIGPGVHWLDTQTGKAWVPGQSVVIARTSNPVNARMFGVVTSYNAGSGVLSVAVPTVASEVIGSGAYSDWTISLTAPRTGMATVEGTTQAAPPGKFGLFFASAPPPGWLKANGAAVSRTTYAALFGWIGTYYGAGDGSTTFNLPEMRGIFPRTWDDGRGVDPGRAFGSYQAPSNLWHTHGGGVTHDAGWHGHTGIAGTAGWHNHAGATTTNGSHAHTVNQTRSAGGGGGPASLKSEDSAGSPIATNYAGDHAHSLLIDGAGNHEHTLFIDGNGQHAHGITGEGGSEPRPHNMALLGCIKF